MASRLDDLLLTPFERDAYPDREFFECLSRFVIASPSSQIADWRSVYASLWPAFCHSLLSCKGKYRPVRWHRVIVNLILSIVPEYLNRKLLLLATAREQIGLHFEAFYVSWISLSDTYYLQKVGQDLRQKGDFVAIINVEGQMSSGNIQIPTYYIGGTWFFEQELMVD